MHIPYFCCMIILSLWLNIEGKLLTPACPTGQRRFLCISLQITISLYRSGITIKIMYIFYSKHTRNRKAVSLLQKCKQLSVEKRISLSKRKTVERIFLEPEFLLINYWWSHSRSDSALYRKPGRENKR